MALMSVRNARKKRKISLEKLAEIAGVSTSQMSRFETGLRRPRFDEVALIAEYLKIPIEAITAELAQEPSQTDANVADMNGFKEVNALPMSSPEARAEVPVLGAVGSGDFQIQDRVETEFISRPPGLAGKRGVYALYVVGTSMAPFHKSGDMIFVDAETQPGQGDDIVLEALRFSGDPSSRRYLRRLAAVTDTHLVCKQATPPLEDHFRKDLVKWVHRVIPRSELLGT